MELLNVIHPTDISSFRWCQVIIVSRVEVAQTAQSLPYEVVIQVIASKLMSAVCHCIFLDKDECRHEVLLSYSFITDTSLAIHTMLRI